MNNSDNRQNSRRCPKCGDKECLIRVRRGFFERLVSRFVSVRRYQCYYCGWQGLIRPKKKPSNHHQSSRKK